ncbi:hypothetical protein IT401_01640 [Candidatus Nomurabacteria bacterium]|nr:hypothetical protein [Candidatus Nomurabacteria bacterium]
MHIATVIPIAKGVPFDTLTYYTAQSLLPGTLVSVPFGKQTIHALVVEVVPLTEAKTFVKRAAFSLKKLSSIKGYVPYFGAVTKALHETSLRTLTPTGAIAGAVLSHALFEYLSFEKIPETFSKSLEERESEERSVIGIRSDRLNEYKRLIRSSFAQKESVLFIAPTIRSLERWKKELEKGISRHVVLFHSKVPKRQLRSQAALLKQEDLPLLIFATPHCSVVPSASPIGSICIEEESNTLYRTRDRYGTDLRLFFRELGRCLGALLVWGDALPRFETLYRTNAHHIARTLVPEKIHTLAISPYRSVLPKEVVELIQHAQKKHRRLFLYTNRKGIAPLSRCGDCGTVVQCPECTLPMTLRNRTTSEGRERFFICLHCSATLPADHRCLTCSSWNIIPVAIGSESVAGAVGELIGRESVFLIDDDFTPDDKAVETLLNQIDKERGAVIVGTQKALPFLQKIDYCIIPFFDRLLSLPSMYTIEQILRLLIEAHEYTKEGVIICTRTPEYPLIEQIEKKQIPHIILQELETRKQLGYPPFGALIKIALTIPERYREEVVTKVDHYFAELDVARLPARRQALVSNTLLLAWLLKTDDSYLEEEGASLRGFLESLHFPFVIEQNPERI